MYKYLPQGGLGVSDPRAQTEDMGDDPVRASEYGMTNLRRIVPNLVEWTTKPGEDYTDLAEIYGEAIGQWSRYTGHVLTLVAGVHVDLKTADQDGAVFDGIPRTEQKRAMDWLAREVFTAPEWLNEPGILELVGPTGGSVANISRRQISVLNRLLDPRRMATLAELEVTQPGDAYPLVEFLDDMRAAVWQDLDRVSRDRGLSPRPAACLPGAHGVPDDGRADGQPLPGYRARREHFRHPPPRPRTTAHGQGRCAAKDEQGGGRPRDRGSSG